MFEGVMKTKSLDDDVNLDGLTWGCMGWGVGRCVVYAKGIIHICGLGNC